MQGPKFKKNKAKKNSQGGSGKRLSFKEQKEQDLLSALDDVYEAEDRKQESENKSSKKVDDQQAPKNKEQKTEQTTPSKNNGRTVVYIDGENTFFQIFDYLRRVKLIRYREDLVKFDLKMLLDHMLGDLRFQGGSLEYRYYGAKLHEEQEDPELQKRTLKMIDHKRRWVGYLSNQGIEFVSAGKLVIRPSINPITKKNELSFNEKGIDVSLAVDMTEAAASHKVNTVVLWSSDQDLKPAMLAAEKNGAKVVYLTHEDRINDVMTGSASETRLIPSDLIKKAYEKTN